MQQIGTGTSLKTHRRSQEKKLGGGGFFVCITDDIATDGGLVPPDYNVI